MRQYTKIEQEKINLYKQIVEAKARIAELKGQVYYNEESEETMQYKALRYTRPELKSDLERHQSAIRRELYTAAEAKARQTSEWAAIETENKNNRLAIFADLHAARNQACNELNQYIHEHFGENAGIRLRQTDAEIGIIDPEQPFFYHDESSNSTEPNFLFGHDMDLQFEKTGYENHEWYVRYELQFNYGTMGSFSTSADPTRVEFLKLMSWAVTDEVFHQMLEERVKNIWEISAVAKKAGRVETERYNTLKEALIDKYMEK